MSEIVYNYDTPANYTIGAGLRVFNSYASLIGHQDSSTTPVLTTNNGADDGGAGEFDDCLSFVRANGDYLVTPDADKLDIAGTNSLTIELWIKFNALDVNYEILNKRYTSTSNYSIQTDGGTSTARNLKFEYVNGATWSEYKTDNNVFTATDTWYHVAVVYTGGDGSSAKIFIDGTEVSASWTVSDGSKELVANDKELNIGKLPSAHSGYINPVDGYIDEVRISNSIRYTSNFTPSTSEFVADANTLYLNHMEDASAHSTSDPAIYKTTGDNIDVASWTSFTEDADKYGADAEIKYQLYNGSNYQYWNGSAWANSNGTYAQSSDASTINSNIGTFQIGSITGFNIKALLHADTADTPILDSITAEYVEGGGVTGVKDFMKFF